MVIKYNIDIDNKVIIEHLDRLTNQIFKLLPSREEGGEWTTPLQNLILEIIGMDILMNNQYQFFLLLCKLEVLQTLVNEDDFFKFRKLIFESLGILNEIKKELA